MNKEVIKAWRTIYSILQETGYAEMYQDEITTIVNFIKEIERLNNIINEIEDFCIVMGKMYEEDYKDNDIASIFNICMLNKIKELKGVDKE